MQDKDNCVFGVVVVHTLVCWEKYPWMGSCPVAGDNKANLTGTISSNKTCHQTLSACQLMRKLIEDKHLRTDLT